MLVFCHGFAKIIFREILAEKEMPVWMICVWNSVYIMWISYCNMWK